MAREIPVFISYARSDERYATELMTRLAQEPDIAPWQDRISMSPGDFEDQLKAGIDSSDYLVLVMTPAALRSPWVEKEWRYARENGRCIVPIRPTFDSPHSDAELDALRAELPVWMQNTQTYDFDRYWKRFVAVLQNPCQAARSPFLAASLPSNFVSRQGEFKRIVDIVLDGARKNPSGKTVVLHGTGGFGKTTLALSVCHDPDVFAACDGGILWVTLGQQPLILTELERIYAALTGDRPGFKNQDDGMFEVAKKLDGKRCLLVIDDVWSVQDLKPFLHGASYGVAACHQSNLQRCGQRRARRALSNQRRRAQCRGSGPHALCWAPRSGRQQAPGSGCWRNGSNACRCCYNSLTAAWSSSSPSGRASMVRSIGRSESTPISACVAFDEKNARERHDAVGNTVEVSLGFLADERQRCLELGVLHEDTDIPFTVLGTLWELRETPGAGIWHSASMMSA